MTVGQEGANLEMGLYWEAAGIFQAKHEVGVRGQALEGERCRMSCFPSCQLGNVTFGYSLPCSQRRKLRWWVALPYIDGSTPDIHKREIFNLLSFGVFLLQQLGLYQNSLCDLRQRTLLL